MHPNFRLFVDGDDMLADVALVAEPIAFDGNFASG